MYTSSNLFDFAYGRSVYNIINSLWFPSYAPLIHRSIKWSGHASSCWPRSLQLNLRDQETHSTASPEKLALWQVSISSLLYCSPHFPLLREASPRSLTRVLSGCLTPAQQRYPPFMTTTTVVPGRNHVRTWMNPHPIIATKAQSSIAALPETGLHQTPESLRCHHIVTCSGHPSKYWPSSLQLNLRDWERHSTASPES
jgi:hypothetical protein